mgnify:CR=1 FL=1
MSAAQFLFDRDEELWWIDEAADGGTHEPDAGHFVRDVPDEMLAELLAVRRRYATLIEELPAAAGLAAATAIHLAIAPGRYACGIGNRWASQVIASTRNRSAVTCRSCCRATSEVADRD